MDQPSVQTVQTGAAASNPTPTSLFQCGTCKRSYTRLDHLARHVRSHTQEKPYTCHVCSKSFTRADLLKRHVAAHDSAPKGVKRQKRAHSPSRQGRVSQACEACAEVHLKCEEKKPCARCLKKNIPCRSSSNAYDNSNVSTADTVDCAANLLALASEEGDRQINSVAFLDAGPMEPTASMDNSSQDPLPFDMAAPASPFHSAPLPDHADLDADLRSLPGFLKSILPSFTDPSNQPTSLWSNGPDSGMWTPRAFVNDFGLDTNLELDDIDMSFLGTYNQEVPFDFDINSQPGGSSVGGKDASDPSRGIAIGSEAFKHTSIWRFRPVSKDTSTSELKNLSVPSVEEAVDSPESRIMIQNPMTIERLAPPTRDKVLALILSQCRPDHVQKTVSAFPSLELLDILLQYYLTCPRSLASNFIHLPTFNPQHRRPELIAAMIAAGAVTAPDKALNKLGYAIQEAVRLGLANSWESDNSGTRATELLQAYIIQLHIGLWSGNNRKMELAESFEQPLATMLRRAGKFRRSAYPATFPREEDCGTVLEARWKEWVDLETTKRLVFNLYRHDGTWSMAMSAGTVISAHELLLPLPEARELWNAPDANTWKNIYLSRYSETILTRRPSLVDCMNDLENLSLGYLPIDERYANLVFLTGVWSLVWEFRRSSSLQKSQSTMWGSNLVLSSRYQELVRLCQHYRMSSPAVLASDYRAAISLELILMHLHISLEDVQLFVGIEGQEEARNVYPLLREWVKTTSARQAIWHAGQVIKIAKSVPRNELGEWVAVGVYHASLVFWAYGLISDPSSTGPTKERANSLSMANTPDAFNLGTIVWLDGDETTEVQRFIALERGTPGIRGLERNASGIGIGPTTLDCPSKAMGLVIEILQNNFDKSIKTKPPLVENLVQLMSSLSVAAREVGS